MQKHCEPGHSQVNTHIPLNSNLLKIKSINAGLLKSKIKLQDKISAKDSFKNAGVKTLPQSDFLHKIIHNNN